MVYNRKKYIQNRYVATYINRYIILNEFIEILNASEASEKIYLTTFVS